MYLNLFINFLTDSDNTICITRICSKLPANNIIKRNPGVEVSNIDKTQLNNLLCINREMLHENVKNFITFRKSINFDLNFYFGDIKKIILTFESYQCIILLTWTKREAKVSFITTKT